MEKRVGVLFIHGMGEHSDDYAHDTIQLLRNRIAGRGLNRDHIAWESIYWQPVLSDREQQVWVDLSARNDLNWVKLRKFLMNAIGGATSYLAKYGDHTYSRIHEKVHASILSLREKLQGSDKPVVVVAHSVGAMIISDYIWDRQTGKDTERFGGTSFERLETLAGLVTFGCNIPLFTFAYDPIVSIAFPPAALPEGLRRRAKWLNLYDPDDVLGWPLKTLSQSYSQTVTEDLEIKVENVLTSWNPMTHATAYWKDQNLAKPVSHLLASILEQCGS